MSEKHPETKIRLKAADGTEWISNMTWQELQDTLKRLRSEQEWCVVAISELRVKVRELEKPNNKAKILTFMQKETKPRTKRYLSNRINGFDYICFEELVAEEKIIKLQKERSTPLYKVKE